MTVNHVIDSPPSLPVGIGGEEDEDEDEVEEEEEDVSDCIVDEGKK